MNDRERFSALPPRSDYVNGYHEGYEDAVFNRQTDLTDRSASWRDGYAYGSEVARFFMAEAKDRAA